MNKQETLEEVAERYADIHAEIFDLTKYSQLPYHHNDRNKVEDAVEFGAKWQQQQNKNLYSEEEVNKFQNIFSKGYICAVAQIIEQHGETTIAENVFKCNFMSIKDMRKIGIDENDIKLLTPIIKEIERKKK